MSKETERAKLHSAIWKIATDLRGAVDGWDFKQYVLGFLFYRFISENLTAYINEEERNAGRAGFDYASISDDEAELGRTDTVKEKGFYILPSELFANLRNNANGDDNLNETLSGIFRNIEQSALGTPSEEDLKGLFDDIDLNSVKALGKTVEKRNQLLVKIIDAVADLDFGNFQDNTIDAFGDAYEYLIGMYAANAGRSGGEYFTPQEVSELLTKITTVGRTEVNKVYDPTCGSGSLLLKFAKILGKNNVRQGFFGQDNNPTLFNLCRMNMFLHDIDSDKFNIACEDTLRHPQHWDDEPFDAIVSNPPYSIHWAGDSDATLINDPRFAPAGVLAPKAYADYAFVMHMLAWLSTVGTAAIVVFPGILYRGNAEKKIRKYLVDNNYIDAIIQLPKDLFFGTNIDTCILVLKKSKTDNDVLFIDASAEFVRGGNKNKLPEASQAKILKWFTERKDIEHITKVASHDEIEAADYKLDVGNYVEKEDLREIINITELNAEITEIVAREAKLRAEIDAIVADIEGAK
jgi:type I restriction enzyme M protein